MKQLSKIFSIVRAHRRIFAGLLLVLSAAAAIVLGNYWFTDIADGVRIGGVAVGGLTRLEARNTLKQALDQTLYRHGLTIRLPQETLELSPAESSVRVRLTHALEAVCTAGASEEISLAPYLQVDEAAVRGLLTRYADRYDTELTQPVWYQEGEVPPLSTDLFDPDGPLPTLVVTLGLPECHLDTEAVYDQILAAMADSVPLCSGGCYEITPQVVPEALPESPKVTELYSQFRIPPVNDRPDLTTYQRIPGSYGLAPHRLKLRRALMTAEYGQSVRIPFTCLTPDVMGEEAYFQDVLGSYETRHTDNENRNTNLRLLCQALDGLVLEPGAVFSFNEAVGERSKERGYLPAPAYSGNRLVDSYGGGVCQGSTTLYNCVLLADLEVVFRACHGAKVTYVPYGLDASVNYLTTDFQFRNSAHFPIRLQAEVSGGYVRMKIWGTDEKDYYIKMETRTGEDELAYYSRSYKCKYDKQTDELLSREIEAYSTYYKAIG